MTFKNHRRLILGQIIVALGLHVMNQCTLGTTPIATLSSGIARSLGVSFGLANMILNLIAIVPVIIINRSYINIGTFYASFLVGPLVNVWQWIETLIEISYPTHVILRLFIASLAVVVLAIGISIYVKENCGLGPIDALCDIIQDKYHITYKRSRRIIDFVLLLSGVLLGGTYGIVTILNLYLVGLIMNVYFEYFK